MGQITRILDDHVQLRLVLDRLRALSAAPLQTLEPSHWRRLLRHEIGLLSRRLVEHFEHEEEGGYMRHVLEARPTMEHRTKELLAEHHKIRHELEALIASARDTPDLDKVRHEIAGLVRVLSDHENAENELVQDALQRDIGLGD